MEILKINFYISFSNNNWMRIQFIVAVDIHRSETQEGAVVTGDLLSVGINGAVLNDVRQVDWSTTK